MSLLEVVLVLVALAVGASVGYLLARSRKQTELRAAEEQAGATLEAARAEGETIRREAEIQAREIVLRSRSQVERDFGERRAELAKREEVAARSEDTLQRKGDLLATREQELAARDKAVSAREQATEAMGKQAEALVNEARSRLEKVAGLTTEQAQARLVEQVKDAARQQCAAEVKKIEDQAKEEAESRGKRILSTAIQRYAGEYVGERTVAVVPLPSDDMKGRIIGREGRNIRALEAATGIDLIIDDTPEAVVVSCFHPIRREIARLALTRLIADGRIHPTRIEEVVAKSTEEVEQQCKEAGEQAVFDLGLHRVHPELVKLLGQLKFRASYAQNLLAHSVEVGFLAGIIADELGQNVKQARRAGLLHDIGKAVDHEVEGAHAVVGGNLARKFGEPPKIAHAISAHHQDEPQESLLDHIVDAANRLSSQRPGARREALQSYVSRLEDLEKLCLGFSGVERAYAIQAGHEVRIVVDHSAVSDEQALLLSKDIARRIEDQASYAGQIRICVIRETRVTSFAR